MPLDVVEVADGLACQLSASGTEERAINEKRYLKSDIEHYGVGVPVIRKMARRFARERRDLSKDALVRLTVELWDRDVYELRKLAVNILAARVSVFGEGDLEFVEGLLRRSHTWALIDDMSFNVVAPVLSEIAGATDIRARWSRDDDFWVRRTAMLALLPGLRRSTDGWSEFADYADAMLGEKEFFIQKAIGWILREVSKRDPDLVAEWLEPRSAIASSVTMREAVKYLPEHRKAQIKQLREIGLGRGKR